MSTADATCELYVLRYDEETKLLFEWIETRVPHPTIASTTYCHSIRLSGRKWRTLKEARVAVHEANKAAHIARIAGRDCGAVHRPEDAL
jgi:hypothetical protein